MQHPNSVASDRQTDRQTDRQAAVKPKETRCSTVSQQPHILQHIDLAVELSCGC